jgi:hypothetical protein
MKKRLSAILSMGVVAVFVLTVLGGCAATQGKGKGSKPQVSVSPAEVKGAGTLAISGKGFKPNQEVEIWTMLGGVLSDISSLVKPKVEKTNGKGAFSAKWKISKRTARLLKTGSFPIIVADKDGNKLASAEFKFEKAKKKKK